MPIHDHVTISKNSRFPRNGNQNLGEFLFDFLVSDSYWSNAICYESSSALSIVSANAYNN